MSFQRDKDGNYLVPIVSLGERLRDNFGLKIAEHSYFDDVNPVHSPNSYHYYDEAIDVTDHRGGKGAGAEGFDGVGYIQRTKNLRDLMRGSGAEVIGPGDMKGHDTHLHLAAKGGIFKLNEDQYNYLFGGKSGGRSSTFAPLTPTTPTPVDPSTPSPVADTQVAPATDYTNMSKQQINAEYDKLRMAGDALKAEQEGMKMHKAFFNKK